MIPVIKVSIPLFGGEPVLVLDKRFHKLRLTKQREAVRIALDQLRQVDMAVTRAIESGTLEAAEDARNADAIRIRA